MTQPKRKFQGCDVLIRVEDQHLVCGFNPKIKKAMRNKRLKVLK